MKKIAFFIACVMLLSTATVFADDAKVLPAGVLRTTIAPTYAFQQGGYDIDGKFVEDEDLDFSLKLFNLGFALEYGVNDFITAAVQWAPGWTIWSEVDTEDNAALAGAVPFGFSAYEPDRKYNVNSVNDLFVGAKIQIIGENAPVKNDSIRLAVAPGVKVPLPGVDFEAQAENMNNKDDVTAADLDNKVLGFGGRFYADVIVNPAFYVNVYSEFIYYLEKKDAEALDLDNSSLNPADWEYVVVKYDYQPGYDFTAELEPHFDATVSDGVTFGAGLPVRYKMTGETKTAGETDEDSATSLLSIAPNVSIFMMKAPIPTEIAVQYNMPLYGTNNPAMHSITLKIKNFLKF